MKSNKEREQDAIEFLRELGKGIPDDQRVMTVFADEATVQIDKETGKKINAGFWPKPYKDGKYIPQESNDYACISSSIKTLNPKTDTMRYWRGELSFGRGLAFFIDDVGSGKGSKGNLQINDIMKVLPATAVVETSPDNYQLWYFFKKPSDNMNYFKAFLQCFVNKVLDGAGGDITIKDVARIGRIPYGFNNKRNTDGSFKYLGEDGKPFRVNLFAADYELRYDMEEIAAAFGFDIVMPTYGSRTDREIEEELDRQLGGMAAAKRKQEEESNAIWFRAARKILNAARMGEGADGRVVENQSGKNRIRCPWGDEHSNGDPYGAYFRARIPGAEFNYVFGCAHDGCRQNKRTWAAFVDAVVIPVIEDMLDKANEYWAASDDIPREE